MARKRHSIRPAGIQDLCGIVVVGQVQVNVRGHVRTSEEPPGLMGSLLRKLQDVIHGAHEEIFYTYWIDIHQA